MNFRLPKSERLHSVKLIEELFSEGSSFFLYPFKVIHKSDAPENMGRASVLFSVPKKKLRKAHQRNLVKRRMREAYRLNKQKLTTQQPIFLGLVYVSQDIMAFSEIEFKMVKILERLTLEYQKKHEDEKPSK